MSCPSCRGTDRVPVAPGYVRCTTLRAEQQPGPAVFGLLGPPVFRTHRVCGTVYATCDGAAGAGYPGGSRWLVPPGGCRYGPNMPTSQRTDTTTIVVMGVSGSGKSTVAATLVDRLGWDFAEGDDLHPPSNVAKMRAGQALDDDDRWPWLRRVAGWIGEHEAAGRPAVVTCSALKRSYRDLLADGHPSVWFAHVTADPDLIRERVEHRTGHYMPATLLDSQLATLQPLADDEPGARISGASPPESVVTELLACLDAERGLRLSTPGTPS